MTHTHTETHSDKNIYEAVIIYTEGVICTHERSFKHVPGEEDLVGGIDGLDRTALDIDYVVDGDGHHGEEDPTDGLDDERSSASLEAVQPHDHQLPQRGPEEKDQNHQHGPQSRRQV